MERLITTDPNIQISGPSHPLIEATHQPSDRRCLVVGFVAGASVTGGPGEPLVVAIYAHNGQFFRAPVEEFEATPDWIRFTTQPIAWVHHDAAE